MGSLVSKAMDENMQKQQEFMQAQQAVVLGRQIQMQNAMRERMMAMQIASQRELLMWTGSFFGIVATGLTIGSFARGKPRFLAPLLPISFLLGYQYDMAYGTKMQRIREMAVDILDDDAKWTALPYGNVTVQEIESRRLKEEKDSKP